MGEYLSKVGEVLAMPKRKKKVIRSAERINARARYRVEDEVTSSIRELAEAKTEKEREKIRARMRRYIGL